MPNLSTLFIFTISILSVSNNRNLTTHVSWPKTIISGQQITTNNIFADATLAVSLQVPTNIRNVVEVKIKQGKQICYPKSIELKPIKWEIFTLDIDQNNINNRWNAQIIAFAYNNENTKAFILLDNGTLFQTNLTIGTQEISLVNSIIIDSFLLVGLGTNWLTSKYQLFLLGSNLYALENQQFSKILVDPTGVWQKDLKTIKRQILSVKQYKNAIYLLYSKQIYRISETGEVLVHKGSKLIDFCLINEEMFVLDELQGLLWLDLANKRQPLSYKIQQISRTTSISATENALFIIYELQKQNYIGQYFIQGSEIILNRYYYNYYSIKSLHLHEQYAVIDSYNQFTIFYHSINRNSFGHNSLQFLYKSHGIKIINIRPLDYMKDLSFLVTFKDKIQVFSFKDSARVPEGRHSGMNSLAVECFSNKSMQSLIQVAYKGICSQPQYSNPKQYICEETKTYLLHYEYNHTRTINQHSMQHLIIILTLSAMIIFSFVVILIKFKKYWKLQRQMKKKYDKIMNRIAQNGVKAEQTFNNDIK